MHNPSSLKEANLLLNSGDHDSAIKIYEAIIEKNHPLKSQAEFNLKLAQKRRMKRSWPVSDKTECPLPVSEPDYNNINISLNELTDLYMERPKEEQQLIKDLAFMTKEAHNTDLMLCELSEKYQLTTSLFESSQRKLTILAKICKSKANFNRISDKEQIACFLKEHDLFDEHWYINTYHDVTALNMPAFEHYMTYGLNEGRLPSPLFTDMPIEKNNNTAVFDFIEKVINEKH